MAQRNKFLWGAATSAHQVEGGNKNNNWWKAENEGRLPYKSGRACNHYELYERDFNMAKELGHNAHRFSIEWSRLEPEEGKFDESELEHYRNVLTALRQRGLEPIVTLHHFTNPVWFEEKGGWERKAAAAEFGRYAEYIAKNLGEHINWWVTINEPMVYSIMGYLDGKWPPFVRNIWRAYEVARIMTDAHSKAHRVIRDLQPEARVGLAHNFPAFVPNKNNVLDKFITTLAKYVFNIWVLKRTLETCDYIGLNYYFYRRMSFFTAWPKYAVPANAFVSDMGKDFEIVPEGLLQVLRELKDYQKPVLITENGLADDNDGERPQYISDHISMVDKALGERIEVIGYLHWSLLDNYEWADGFDPRFGLIEVDYDTQKRTIRQSAYKYKQIIEKYSSKWNG